MNAREALQLIGDLRLDQLTIGELAAINDAGLRALRLLAAAESNDGTTQETNDLAALLTDRTMVEGIILDRMRCLERERNGLAAMVVELEREMHEHNVQLVEAIYGQPCPTPQQWARMQGVAAKAMAARRA